jgi:hypothetical protein
MKIYYIHFTLEYHMLNAYLFLHKNICILEKKTQKISKLNKNLFISFSYLRIYRYQ